jgi:hypothetical protein
MKGPMTTQTLRGLKGMEPLHWRGDRATFLNFNPAFDSLMGGEPLSNEDMQAYKSFIETIVFEPNPNRNLDNSLPQSLAGGDPGAGENFFRNTPFLIPVAGSSLKCANCHDHPTGVTAASRFRIAQGDNIDIVQPLKVPHLRNVYQMVYFDNAPGAESLAGFGLEHDGVKAGIAQAHTGPRFEGIQDDKTIIDNLTAFLLCFETGTRPAVGYNLTVRQDNLLSADLTNEWNTLEQQALQGRIDLIAKAEFGGLLYDRGSRNYRSDLQPDLTRSRAWIESQVTQGATVTFMGVPLGAGLRMGIDRDLNGSLDGVDRSKLALTLATRIGTIAPATFEFLLNGPPGVTVMLQRTTDLQNWQDWQTRTIAETATALSDSEAGTHPRLFYRAQLQGVSP